MKKLILLCIIIGFIINNAKAQWQPVTGPYGGSITSIAVKDSNIFAGTEYGGVFLSTNNGVTWTAMNNGLTDLLINCIAIKDSDIFVGTFLGGIFLSTNNGASWTAINNGLTDFYVYSFAISGSNIYAGTEGGLVLSTNNGYSWTSVDSSFPAGDNEIIYSLAASGPNIFAGTFENGIFLSTDSGSNWISISNGLPINSDVDFIAISDSNIWAVIDTAGATQGGSGLFLSADYGNNWTPINLGANKEVTSVAIDGPNILVSTDSNGIFLSNNNGANWTSFDIDFLNVGVNVLLTDDSEIYAGTTDGVFLSTTNGSNWSGGLTGMTNTIISSIVMSGSDIFTFDGYGIFLSTDSGSTWTERDSGITNLAIQCLATRDSTIFAGTYEGGVFLSTNNGRNWVVVNSGLTNLDVNALAINGQYVFAGTDVGVFLSNNNGASWTLVTNFPQYTYVYALAIRDSNIFAGTQHGVFLSNNNGGNWTSVGLTDTIILSLAINDSIIVAGADGEGVFSSNNNGDTWTAIDSLPEGVLSLAINGSDIFAGTFASGDGGGGVFLSANGGNWLEVNTGLPNTNVFSLAIIGSNLFAGTYGSGIWKQLLANVIQSPAVWPGDANDDGIVNNNDILAIGLAYGFTGPVRPTASLVWVGQPAPEWDTTFPSGLNVKYADCDGNGVINANDTLAVALNYSLTHQKSNGTRSITGPPLYIQFPPMDSVEAGTILQVPVYLGTDINPIDSIIGLAFTINYNISNIDSNGALFFTGSMLDTSGANLLTFKKSPAQGEADIAMIRTDHHNVSSYGFLCSIEYQDLAFGKGDFSTVLPFTISNVTAITANGTPVPLSYGEVDTVIEYGYDGIERIAQSSSNFTLSPNPTNNNFTIETNITTQPLMQVFDIAGKLMFTQTIQNNKTTIDVSSLAEGMYLVSLKSADGVGTEKLVIAK